MTMPETTEDGVGQGTLFGAVHAAPGRDAGRAYRSQGRIVMKRMEKLPKNWSKAPHRSHWEHNDDQSEFVLMMGTKVIGRVVQDEQKQADERYHVWGRSVGDSDATGNFATLEEAVAALVEHVLEHGPTGLSEKKPPPPCLADRQYLVRDIRLRSLMIGIVALLGSLSMLAHHFVGRPILLGIGSSLALTAALLAFTWRAEAGRRDP